MARTRVSTTVDAELLEGARRVRSGVTDAALIDEALGALLDRHRAAEVDASYAAYDEAEARAHRPQVVFVDEANRAVPSPPIEALLPA